MLHVNAYLRAYLTTIGVAKIVTNAHFYTFSLSTSDKYLKMYENRFFLGDSGNR